MRCVSVIRGISNPFAVDLISNNDDEFGVVVPIPAAPLEGNILVWAVKFFEMMKLIIINKTVNIFFMIFILTELSYRFVEIPIRRGTLKKYFQGLKRGRIRLYFTSIVILVLSSFTKNAIEKFKAKR